MSKTKESYKEYLLSDDWKEKRRKKLRSTNKCGICASTKQLDVHHLNYRNWTDVQQSDLRVLCRKCHFLAHDLEKSSQLVYRNKNHHSRWALLKDAVKKAQKRQMVNLFK